MSSPKQFYCSICDKTYSYRQSLFQHNKTFHQPVNTNNNKIYKCEKCNKEYKHKQSCWRHKKTCNNNINYKLLYEELRNDFINLLNNAQFLFENLEI